MSLRGSRTKMLSAETFYVAGFAVCLRSFRFAPGKNKGLFRFPGNQIE